MEAPAPDGSDRRPGRVSPSRIGVAIIALVFASHGGYDSPKSFFDGVGPATRVAAAAALAGVIPARFAPTRAGHPWASRSYE